MTRSVAPWLAFVVGITIAAPGSAHHSFAMFDKTQTKALDGTLYAFEWKNPHSWVWVVAKEANGDKTTFGFEGGSPMMLSKQGYTKENFKVGTKVHVTYNPLRDGRPGGSLIDIKADAGAPAAPAAAVQ